MQKGRGDGVSETWGCCSGYIFPKPRHTKEWNIQTLCSLPTSRGSQPHTMDHETRAGWGGSQLSLTSVLVLQGSPGQTGKRELAGKAKGIHLFQPSNVLPEELGFTDNPAPINCYSWLTGSQPLCTGDLPGLRITDKQIPLSQGRLWAATMLDYVSLSGFRAWSNSIFKLSRFHK